MPIVKPPAEAPPNVFGAWLRKKRNERQWSLRELAQRTGISNPQISYLELRSHGITVSQFVALCQAFDCKIEPTLRELGYIP
jgi:transcriptional regulator with XRE-family HTH domain